MNVRPKVKNPVFGASRQEVSVLAWNRGCLSCRAGLQWLVQLGLLVRNIQKVKFATQNYPRPPCAQGAKAMTPWKGPLLSPADHPDKGPRRPESGPRCAGFGQRENDDKGLTCLFFRLSSHSSGAALRHLNFPDGKPSGVQTTGGICAYN